MSTRDKATVQAELNEAAAKLPAIRVKLGENMLAMHNGIPGALEESRRLARESKEATSLVNRLMRELRALS